jgi:hypothetical protein
LIRRGPKLHRLGHDTGTEADPLRRVYDIGMRTCPNCGQGRLEPIATILDPDAMESRDEARITPAATWDPRP